MSLGPDIYFDDAGEPCLTDVPESQGESFEDALLSAGVPVDSLGEIIALAERTFAPVQIRDSSWLPQILRLISAPPATEAQIGRRVLMILFLLNAGDFETMSTLARRLGVSPQRTSQALETFSKNFPMFSAFSRKAP